MTGQVSHLFVLKSREVFALFGITPPFWLQLHLITEIGCWPYQSPYAVFRLGDEAVRVGIRLAGLNLCEPHTCRCGAMVDARGLHSFVCKSALSRTARHHALNDIICRAFSSAGIPATKETVGLTRLDVKRPEADGLTLQCPGVPANPTWDVTAACQHYGGLINVDSAAREAGAPYS